MSGAEAVRTRVGLGARGAVGSRWRSREREERVKRRNGHFSLLTWGCVGASQSPASPLLSRAKWRPRKSGPARLAPPPSLEVYCPIRPRGSGSQLVPPPAPEVGGRRVLKSCGSRPSRLRACRRPGLLLKRAPGIRSWSLLVGILSIGLAAAYYSGDSLGWKLFYVTGCLFVAVQNLEDWEEAVFNKSTGKVVLKTFSLYRKLLTLCRAGHDQVVVLLSDIRDVNVEEEKVRYFGKGYVVVLRFATGFSHPLTQSAVMGHRSDVEAVAKLITAFLELHRLESPVELSQSSDSEADGPGDQS
ncbi:hypothetical protein R6Z07F_011067 [Ovis aries]